MRAVSNHTYAGETKPSTKYSRASLANFIRANTPPSFLVAAENSRRYKSVGTSNRTRALCALGVAQGMFSEEDFFALSSGNAKNCLCSYEDSNGQPRYAGTVCCCCNERGRGDSDLCAKRIVAGRPGAWFVMSTRANPSYCSAIAATPCSSFAK